MAFPRFFFLSNDDLLHILSQTKEPLRVQEHMNKCFEGIHRLKFEEDLKITGMFSQMGEFIKFDSVIDPIHIKTSEEMAEERREAEQELLELG